MGLNFMVDGRKKKRAHESVKLNICVSQIVQIKHLRDLPMAFNLNIHNA